MWKTFPVLPPATPQPGDIPSMQTDREINLKNPDGPPSEQQMALVKRFKIRIPADATMAVVSEKISAFKARNPAKWDAYVRERVESRADRALEVARSVHGDSAPSREAIIDAISGEQSLSYPLMVRLRTALSKGVDALGLQSLLQPASA